MINSIDIRQETPITFKEAVDYIPKRNGRKMHYSTIFRWATRGVRGRMLPSVLVGGVRFTTVEALSRFMSTCPSIPREGMPQEDLQAIDLALREAGL